MNDYAGKRSKANRKRKQEKRSGWLLVCLLIITTLAVITAGCAVNGGFTTHPITELATAINGGQEQQDDPVEDETPEPKETPEPAETPEPTETAPEETPGITHEAIATPTTAPTPVPTPTPSLIPFEQDPDYFKDALFIGDSRMYGMSKYGAVQGASYFARESMRMSKALSSTAQNSPDDSRTMREYLEQTQINKIYILLGINDYSSSPLSIKRTFEKFIAEVRQMNPDMRFFIIANMHVTKEKSKDGQEGKLSNTVIDNMNAALAELDDGNTVFYLDVAALYDDESGAMNPSYTGDGIHLRGRHYAVLRDWIQENGRRYW